MSSPRTLRRRVAWAVATTLALSATVAPAATAASTDPQPDGDAKVEASVARALTAEKESTFYVVMDDQADLSAAERRKSHTAKAEATVEALQDTATTTQEPVRALLDAEGVGYEPFWIANVLRVTTDDPAVVEQLTARDDVAEIVGEQHYELQDSEASPAALASAVESATEADGTADETGTTADDAVTPEWGVADIKADQVWSTYDDRGEGIVIANIDSGVQYDHPALVDSYRGNLGDGTFDHDYNFYDPTGTCGDTPCDNNGHGTHTMGTMVGADGIGVAPGATWIAAKGCEARSCSDASLLAAGQWILAPTDANGQNPRPDLAPNVVNNSWGGGQTSFYGETVAAWNAAGIFDAFAAGNDGDGRTCSTATSPGAQQAVYAVGAYDAAGKIASFSGYGPSALDGSATPSLSAPGVNVRSTYPGSTYTALNGTSMATPHVAGAVALLWAQAPSLIGNIEGTRTLLDDTARDVEDVRCGGDADDNNVWGEGKLDVLAAVDAAPHTAATVTGTVTDTDGAPASNVTVKASGTGVSRTVTTKADGSYRMTLAAGTYTLDVAGYGYAPQSLEGVELAAGEDVAQDFSLAAVPSHAVTGTVHDANGDVLARATVAVSGTPLDAVTTDARGRFSVPAVAEGDYTLVTRPAAPVLCNGVGSDPLTVDGAETVTVDLPARTDVLGNSCTEVRSSWVSGRDRVALTGDEDATTLALPFPVSFYGVSYSNVNVTTNGLVNFLQPRLGDYANTALPAEAAPNGIVAAYWDDLVLDRLSKVSTTTTGKAGARTFAIVWENARLDSDPSRRVSFEVLFDEATSDITLQYRGLKGDVEKGSSATVGIENQAGTVALDYAVDAALLADDTAITFTPSEVADPAAGDGAGSKAMKLTQKQADILAGRLNLDPYGDDVADTEDADEATAADDAAANEEAATADEDAALTVTKRSAIESVDGMSVTGSLDGTDGGYVVLSALGTVQRRTADGDVVWTRGNDDYYGQWQVKNVRPWQSVPFRVRTVMGFNAVGVGTPSSDQGWATGDLSGDGVDDVVFSASAGVTPYRPFTSPGSSLPNGTFVSVLDGATGDMLWHKLYAGAHAISLVGDTLLVADSPTNNLNAPAGATATLTALELTPDGEGLTAEELWSYDTGAGAAAVWSTIEPLGDGRVAVGWNQRKTSLDAVPSGHTLVLDVADGSTVWSQTDRRYSRQLHLDATHDRLLALEQSDTMDAVDYAVVAYSLAGGERSVLETRVNALPIDLVVGDLDLGKGDAFAVSEATFDSNLVVNASTVRAFDGREGGLMWSRTVKRDKANIDNGAIAWGLQAVDGRLVVSYQDDAGNEGAANRGALRAARLAVLLGPTGTVLWEKRGLAVASQTAAEPVRGLGWNLRTVDPDQNVHTYTLLTGRERDVLPMQAELSSAVTTRVDGDEHLDVVVGGESRGVWAYSGPSLVGGEPRELWHTTVPGQIHAMVTADVDGDGKDEVLVAADSATVVLDARTGKVLRTIDGGAQFVRTVAASDLDGDGDEEIVVATDAVRAYDGRGRQVWSYAPKDAGEVVFADVSFGDGQVYAQYVSQKGLDLDETAAGGVALAAADGSVAWTVDPNPAGSTNGVVRAVPLRHGTFASPEIPYADGHAVVYTWYADATEPFKNTYNFVEIRDGRTGELLHTTATGGLWTHGNFITTPDGLVQAGSASLRTWTPDGVDHQTLTVPLISTADLATGPGGRSLIVAAGAGGFSVYDPAVLTAGRQYPPSLASGLTPGGREALVADLDSDGVDEVLMLNFDEVGTDRAAELLGGGYRISENGIRHLTTFGIDAS
ncbi:hypothetical protein GCM10009809_38430 [Isoptericola hypogeus]|uniref:Peptidase S8/S53 domain-containing protein n=1 Tax=Isoptericola hypogeus TaxID=300179 RepID=A0ABP4VYB0_9MICO